MMRKLIRFFVVPFVLLASSTLLAGGADELETVLSKRIIDPNLPLQEVQEFTESRVLPMPQVKDVADWEKHANRMRQETLDRVVFRGEAAGWRDAKTKVEWLETLPGGPGYRIRKLRYESLPGLWIPALLYEPKELTDKVPVVLNVNGHGREFGKAGENKQLRCINQAKRGMLALNLEWMGMGQLYTEGFGHYRMNQIDLCATSGIATHYLAMKRGIDILLNHKHADAKRVAVTGLSGGGWQTIFISALDTRVTLSNPVAGYSSFRTRARFFSDLGDSEQTPVDLGITADYSQLTAMRAPRPTLLTFNAQDNCCFRADHALEPLLQAAAPIFALYGKPKNLRSHINEDPGTHNFGLDNRQQLYRMIGDHFFAGEKSFVAKEIPSNDELKSKADLLVELPKENADFHTLALSLSKNLPRNAALPGDAKSIPKWRAERRKALAELLRLDEYGVQAIEGAKTELEEGTAIDWRLRIGGNWTVPATELTGKEANSTVILIADAGRKRVAAEAQALLNAGHRVLAVDLFYMGESKIAKRDFLFGLLVSAVGKRPLGVQAAQLTAIAAWSKKQHGVPVRLLAIGPRTSLMALTAAALKPAALEQVELRKSYGSLKEIIEQNLGVNDAPELFCFGLLEQFDILQLAALAAPTPVRFTAASDRVKTEIAPLASFYALLDVEVDPLK
jgi:dienelactone hydrolase